MSIENRVKRVYPHLWWGLSTTGAARAAHHLRHATGSARVAHAGSLLAHGAPLAFAGYLYAGQRGRTSRDVPGLRAATAAGALTALVARAPRGERRSALAVAGLTELYVRWYSRFGRSPSPGLRVGGGFPDCAFVENGRPVRSGELTDRPTVWMFIRGNWCPLCMAQSRAIAERYREIETMGAQVALIAAQDEAQTRALAARLGVRFRYLTDPGLRTARELGVWHEAGVPAGMPGFDSDTVLPTIVVTRAGGEIVFCDETDNYRVRPTPDTIITALQRAR